MASIIAEQTDEGSEKNSKYKRPTLSLSRED
jgi:hypothetical protein